MSHQRAVLADRLGGPDVLRVDEVPVPTPGEGRALLDVRAVGLNPYDSKVREGVAPRDVPFPRGAGTDVAGIVVAVGPDTAYADGTPVAVGDEVFGWGVNTLRERLIVRGTSVARVPDDLDLTVAGALTTPALAARALFESIPVTAGDVVLVTGASGAVGFLVAQWAARTGARVIGTAGEANAERLREVGVEPVAYGDGLAERLAGMLADQPATAVFDTAGQDAIDAALELGTPAARIATLSGAGADDGVTAVDTSKRSSLTLANVGADVASGQLRFPVQATFPLDETAQAFDLLDSRRLTGKVVVTPNA